MGAREMLERVLKGQRALFEAIESLDRKVDAHIASHAVAEAATRDSEINRDSAALVAVEAAGDARDGIDELLRLARSRPSES